MASDQVQMYHISQSEKPDDKENVILRTLIGDPNRHKPLAHHAAPTTAAAQEAIPASMYTLETRYRPIPPKVLPQSAKPKVYYLESQKIEQPSEPDPVMKQEEPEARLPVEQEIPKDLEQESIPTVFLEPKVILQPVLYSIVGAKKVPIENNQPIQTITTTTTEMPLPILYNLVAYPRLQTRIQEPVKQVSDIPQQSISSLHTIIGNPHVQQPIQEPAQKTTLISKQRLPILYSIVANPTLTSRITYTNSPDVLPATQPIRDSSVQPPPLLYTVVGETQVPNNILTESRPPLGPVKRHANDVAMFAVVGGPRAPKSMTIPQKTQPFEPQKIQPLEPKKTQRLEPLKQPQQPQQQQASVPALYPLVGKPTSPPKENMQTESKPPKTLAPIQRVSRSLERQSAPESRTKPATSISPIKKKPQPRLKEPTIPKSETIFLPLPKKERTPRPKQPRIDTWNTSPEYQAHLIPNYNPLRLPDYISPYSYHPLKSYSEKTVHPTTLPIITNNHSPRNPRRPLDEPNYRAERKHPNDLRKPHSLERYPVRHQGRPRLWDYEYDTETDVDDDPDQLYTNRSRGRYRRRRPRSPWIPVW